MQYPSLSAGAFVAAFLVCLPVPFFWRTRNVPALTFTAWLLTIDIILGVNALVWDGSTMPRIPVWCDITTKLMIGFYSASSGAILSICKNLEMVASGRSACLTYNQKRRQLLLDLALCIGIPVILMALHCIVQGHRFGIVENFGCRPAIFYSVPAIFLVWVPVIVMYIVALIFAGLALYRFFHNRITFPPHLVHSDASIDHSLFVRFLAFSFVEIIWGISIVGVTIHMYDSVSSGLLHWSHLHTVNSQLSYIIQLPTAYISSSTLHHLLFLWWSTPISSYLLFLLYCTSPDALEPYHNALSWIRRKTLRQNPLTAPLVDASNRGKTFLRPAVLSINVDLANASAGEKKPAQQSPAHAKSRPVSNASTVSTSSSNSISLTIGSLLDDLPLTGPSTASRYSASSYASSRIAISAARAPTPPLQVLAPADTLRVPPCTMTRRPRNIEAKFLAPGPRRDRPFCSPTVVAFAPGEHMMNRTDAVQVFTTVYTHVV